MHGGEFFTLCSRVTPRQLLDGLFLRAQSRAKTRSQAELGIEERFHSKKYGANNMQTATYDVLEDDEACPFDGSCDPASREMTFKIATRDGVRFDRAVLIDGASAQLDWLWPGKIPLGRVTLLEGPAGAGKSFVALDLVSRLCDDRPWPDGVPHSRNGAKGLILCRQDDACSIVGARLEALGADPERCMQFLEFETVDEEGARFRERPVSLPLDLPALERLLDRDLSIRLVVIDPLSDFCSGKKDLAELIHQLNKLVRERPVAILATLRATARFDRQGGLVVKSRYETEAARCTWCCVPDPEDPDRQLFLPTLMSCGELPAGHAFRIGDMRIDWDEKQIDPRHPLRSESVCARWLREFLQEGSQRATVTKRLGKEFGFSEGQVNRASVKIKVRKERDGFGKGTAVYWSLATDRPTPMGRHRDPEDDRRRAAEIPTDPISTDQILTKESGDGASHEDERQSGESQDDRMGDDPDEQEVARSASTEEVAQTVNEKPVERQAATEHHDANPAAPVAMALPGQEAEQPAPAPQLPVESNRRPLSRADLQIPWEGSPSSRLNPLGALLDQIDSSRRSDVGK
jgi:hypothetical protein